MASTTIITLTTTEWTNIVNDTDSFLLSLVSGTPVRVAVTNSATSPAVAGLEESHMLSRKHGSFLRRSDTGDGYIWVRLNTTLKPTDIALTK
jgi:hypothetical protein